LKKKECCNTGKGTLKTTKIARIQKEEMPWYLLAYVVHLQHLIATHDALHKCDGDHCIVETCPCTLLVLKLRIRKGISKNSLWIEAKIEGRDKSAREVGGERRMLGGTCFAEL
jgi:hypothetical protein